MARAALRLSVDQVAELAGIGSETLRKLERGVFAPRTKTAIIDKLQTAYQTRGVIFLIATLNEPPGVRYQAPTALKH